MGSFGLKNLSNPVRLGIRGTNKNHSFMVLVSLHILETPKLSYPKLNDFREIWWYSLILSRGGYTWACSDRDIRDGLALWSSEGGPGMSC